MRWWTGPGAIGTAAFAAALVVIALSSQTPHPPLAKTAALAAARADPDVASFVARGYTRVTVIPLDRGHWRVTYWDGPREVLDAAVNRQRRVDALEPHPAGLNQPGAAVLWHRALLALLVTAFLGVVAVRPLRALRNLDALAIAVGFTLAAGVFDYRLVAAHVVVAAATLAYTAFRLGQVAFGRDAGRRAVEPLFRLPVAARTSTVLTALIAIGAAIVVITSTGASDVALAVMSGATQLAHGVSPYGHITKDVVHGDTYPPLTYVLFLPAAALKPVRDGFSSLDGALWLNAAALLAAAWLLHLRGGARWALAWLTFPAILLSASTGGNDTPTALFVVAAAVYSARATLAASLLTLAGWIKIGPVIALLPYLATMRGGRLRRAAAAAAAISAACIVWLAASGALHAATSAIRFQLVRGSWFSVWQQIGSHGAQHLFQALTVGVLVAAAVSVGRSRSVNRALAAGGMGVALLQLGANYWTYAYLPWLMPFVIVALFPPERLRSPQPAPPAP